MHCVHIFLIVKRVSFLFFCSPSRINFQPLGNKVTPVETAWTQSGSQSMILQSGAAGPENLIEMQILNSSWDLLSQPDALCWPSGCVLTRAPGDSGLSKELPLLIQAPDLAASPTSHPGHPSSKAVFLLGRLNWHSCMALAQEGWVTHVPGQ